MPDINETLAERQKTHGDFSTHAVIAQHLKAAMTATDSWAALSPVQKEALEMIQHKVARILNGNANTKDHWHDISGYAKLAEDRCYQDPRPLKAPSKLEGRAVLYTKPEMHGSLRPAQD